MGNPEHVSLEPFHTTRQAELWIEKMGEAEGWCWGAHAKGRARVGGDLGALEAIGHLGIYAETATSRPITPIFVSALAPHHKTGRSLD